MLQSLSITAKKEQKTSSSKHLLHLNQTSTSKILEDAQSWSMPSPNPTKSLKNEKEMRFGLRADTISHVSHHPQLLTMKDCSREKVLTEKKAQYDPPPALPIQVVR